MHRLGLEFYQFKPYRFVVDGYTILDAARVGEAVSPLTGAVARANGGTVEVSVEGCSARLPLDSLRRLRGDYFYRVECGSGVRALAVSGEGFVARLHAPWPGAPPTIMINGVLMHRVTGVDPLSDAELKVGAARIPKGSRVLDVCTGLGYTAISALRHGASRVYTVEINEYVLWLARHNPASWQLENQRIHILLGDAVSVVRFLPDSFFDRIIHDPPRFQLAGQLYSLEFYRELYRVLRPGGLLFHYTGEPMRSRGRGAGPIVRGVIERLRLAGFIVRGYARRVMGVLAVKPG